MSNLFIVFVIFNISKNNLILCLIPVCFNIVAIVMTLAELVSGILWRLMES